MQGNERRRRGTKVPRTTKKEKPLGGGRQAEEKKVIYHTNLTFSFTPTPLKIVR